MKPTGTLLAEMLGIGPAKVREILDSVLPGLPEEEKHSIVFEFPSALEKIYKASINQFRDNKGNLVENSERKQLEVVLSICLVDIIARLDKPHVWRVANDIAMRILQEANIIDHHVQAQDAFIEIYDRFGKPWFVMRRDGSVFLAPSATKEECAQLFWEEVKRIAWQHVNIERSVPSGPDKPPVMN